MFPIEATPFQRSLFLGLISQLNSLTVLSGLSNKHKKPIEAIKLFLDTLHPFSDTLQTILPGNKKNVVVT